MRLIVTADDFGRSASVNRAVEQAAESGILTCAGLMVTGQAAGDAVRIAQSLPQLQVGLHLTLTELPPRLREQRHPLLHARDGSCLNSPARVGLALQFSKKVAQQVEREVAAQFEAFARTGLPFEHVDCHHHLHIHPKLFDIVLKYALEYHLKSIRVPVELWPISGPLCTGHGLRNLAYRMVFGLLGAACRKKLSRTNLVTCDGVFGLYQTGEISEQWLLGLLDKLQNLQGVYELYVHPEYDHGYQGFRELEALVSQAVRKKIEDSGVELVRYRDMGQC